MKKIIFVISCFVILVCCFSACKSKQHQEASTVVQDSTLNVIGYYSKNDTLIYSMIVSDWKITPSDEILNYQNNSKVRITVVDSNSVGYTLDYTVLGCEFDTAADLFYETITKKGIERIQKNIVGKQVLFETDKCGAITRFCNLNEIERMAVPLYKESLNDMLQMPEAVMEHGYNVDSLKKMMDISTIEIVNNYLEDLRTLFACTGRYFKIGMTTTSLDVTDTTCGYTTSTFAEIDSSNCTYKIIIESNNVVSSSKKMEYLGWIGTDAYNGSIDENGIFSVKLIAKYIELGWPYEVILQKKGTVCGRGRLIQMQFLLDGFDDQLLSE